jgi:exosortase/archaeosortase family protein
MRLAWRPPTGVLVRAAIILAATVGAYHYSLATLLSGLSLQSPLAYLGLVPFIALLLAVVIGLTPHNEPDIEDRFVDYAIALPLLTAALATLLILPVHAAEYFWLWRLDVLSLPLFVAGAIALLFGVRVLWRLRWPILYLLAAWPLPYVLFLTNWMGAFTDTTLAALRLALSVIPVATPLAASDGSLFSIAHAGRSFVLSVASACAGVNGLAAFIVVGAAFATIVHGRLINKGLWLGFGMLLICLLNLVRILLIFAGGSVVGEEFAVDGLHPVIGLVTFGVGVVLMALVLPVFRLTIEHANPSGATRQRAPRVVPRRAIAPTRVAVPLLLTVTMAAGLANANLAQFASTFSDLGPPRVSGLTALSAQVSGWSLRQTATYPWSRPYFGPDSTWVRYQYTPAADNQSNFRPADPVILDVISTSDSSAFSVYGLEACYNFHNYRMVDVRSVDLGGGVIAKSIVYYNPARHADWLAVYWQWPVQSSGGLRYQRVVLNMTDVSHTASSSQPTSPSLARALGLTITDILDSPTQASLDAPMSNGRNFLVGFAQQLVAGTTSGTTALVGS